MNLFSVKSNSTNKVIDIVQDDGVVKPAFFTNKQDAKTFRDSLNKSRAIGYYVSKGPDHRNYIGK